MRALIVDAHGHAQLVDDQPEPTPGPDDALVHVTAAGICDTDLQLLRGYAGFRGVLGHEFVGRVDAADPVLAGARVVADINVACGTCLRCLGHDPHHCSHRTTLGIRDRPGVFAERVAIPRANLVRVPDVVDDALAVFAEPLAAGLHVLDELGDLDVAERIEVLGDGKLGLLIGMGLAAAGRRVRVIGHHPDKLALARAAGVETALEHELTETARSSAAVIVEATGHPSGLTRALWLARPRATIVLKTTSATPLQLDLAKLVVDELRLVGSRCGDMQRAIDLLASGRVDPRPLIAGRYPLAAALAALAHAGRRGALKLLLEPHARRDRD
jgi:threonine dehydrogenase-like Zn-dependent dehydrogenase